MRVRRRAQQRLLWVVLPFRGIARGKSRLAAVLDASERARFNRRLFMHTLQVVAAWQGGSSRCIVVSRCARALRLACELGASALPEACPYGDLNRAIEFATRAARRCGAHRVLVLSCDLPWLSQQALNELLDRSAAGTQLVLATDASNTGTNALLLNTRGRFSYSYGADSRTRHINAARRRGWSSDVVTREELARDIDTPNDLARWKRAANGRSGL